MGRDDIARDDASVVRRRCGPKRAACADRILQARRFRWASYTFCCAASARCRSPGIAHTEKELRDHETPGSLLGIRLIRCCRLAQGPLFEVDWVKTLKAR